MPSVGQMEGTGTRGSPWRVPRTGKRAGSKVFRPARLNGQGLSWRRSSTRSRPANYVESGGPAAFRLRQVTPRELAGLAPNRIGTGNRRGPWEPNTFRLPRVPDDREAPARSAAIRPERDPGHGLRHLFRKNIGAGPRFAGPYNGRVVAVFRSAVRGFRVIGWRPRASDHQPSPSANWPPSSGSSEVLTTSQVVCPSGPTPWPKAVPGP